MHSQRLSDADSVEGFDHPDDKSTRSVPPNKSSADDQLQLMNRTPYKKSQDSMSIKTEPSTPGFQRGDINFNFIPLEESSTLKSQETNVVLPQVETASKSLLPILFTKVIEGEQKLTNQWKAMIKCDKYLRLVCAIIKTYRAYKPKTHLNKVYKELILARRVIRWEGKYDTLIELFSQKIETPMKLFKIFQITGDIVDLTAFWLKTCSTGNKSEKIIEKLEQIESNFYFLECIIWTGIYAYRYYKLKKEAGSDQKKLLEAKNKLFENGIKFIKYVMDVLTSYNNSSLKAHAGQINLKIAGVLTVLSSLIGIFLLWR